MGNILDAGKDIVSEIERTGNPRLLFDLFDVRKESWRYHIIHDELISYGVFSDITKLNSILAFKLISTAVEITVNQSNEDLFTTALDMLLTCIEQSDTTEIPSELLNHWKYITKKVIEFNSKESMEIWSQINKWYRIDERDYIR